MVVVAVWRAQERAANRSSSAGRTSEQQLPVVRVVESTAHRELKHKFDIRISYVDPITYA